MTAAEEMAVATAMATLMATAMATPTARMSDDGKDNSVSGKDDNTMARMTTMAKTMTVVATAFLPDMQQSTT
jgi:hypothetical protein